ncbi:hypothetical protein PTSG_07133 [Salpingoeca rosetta]|uniref:LRRK2 ARM repeat domain-containing protein n=1 Tax=Salpingoeca rosetta (strain ATCC 50818 / BSB-021) TaxID=946362 RepID=F2UE55_SALR5|nr:uncharacterized protein PTSG_07133 [Salpingoeca rosetta]EGD74905.1 hypothetical protein PTSG_07133 [Salpingoeca rosetta]|eukprot:XP_004992550.1 hypothetical protein PTSG_07133 [Salpingoeca rosetta]
MESGSGDGSEDGAVPVAGDDQLQELRERIGRQIKLDGTIIDAIKGMTGMLSERSPHICSWGCRAVMNVARSDVQDVPALQELNALEAVLRCIRLHPQDESVLTSALGALRYLFAADVCAQLFDASMAAVLVVAVREHGSDKPIILEHASGCCSALSNTGEGRTMLGDSGVLEAILGAASHHLTDEPTPALRMAIAAVAAMCQNHDGNSGRAETNGGLPLCRNVLFKYTAHPDTLAAVFTLLECLSTRDSFRECVRTEHLLPAVVAALTAHAATHVSLAESGCRLVARLAQSEENRVQLLILNILPVIIDVLEIHKDHTDAILYACWAIVELAVSNFPEEGEEHDTLDEDDDRGERADSGPQGEESASVLGLASPRFSVVSGPFEGPTTYEPDDEDISVLSEHEQAFEDVITSILKNMKQHKDKADVHRYGTLALENLASRSERLRVAIAVKNGVHIIIIGMKHHMKEPHVLANAAHALAVLAADDEKMHRHITMIRGINYTLKAMAMHPEEEDVQFNACRLLANLCLTPEVCEEAMRQHAATMCLNALDRHRSNFDVLVYGFRLLENLSTQAAVRKQLQEDGRALRICLDGLKAHASDADLQISGIRLLERLSFNENNHVVANSACVSAVLFALEMHLKLGDVVASSLFTLNSLALNGANRQAIMAAHGHELLMLVIKRWRRRADLLKYACGALSNLAFKSDKIRQALLVAGVAKAMCALIKDKIDEPEVILPACAVLRNLSSHIKSHRKSVYDAGAFETMATVLSEHGADTTLVYWAFGVLNNICREPAIKREAVRIGWVDRCTAAMNQFEETSPAYQAALELWTRLPKPKKHDRSGVRVETTPDSVQEMTGAELMTFA